MSQISPEAWVAGELHEPDFSLIAEQGVFVVISLLQAEAERCDEAACASEAHMVFERLPIDDTDALTQVNMMQLDRLIRMYHGKPLLLHCTNRERAAAAWALRMGWLRGRKMDLCLQAAEEHGVGELKDELHKRLLVPR